MVRNVINRTPTPLSAARYIATASTYRGVIHHVPIGKEQVFIWYKDTPFML